MSPEEIILELLKVIEESLIEFEKSMPGLQRNAFDDITDIIMTLDVRNGNVRNSIGNLRKINSITRRVERAVLSPEYKKQISLFLKTYGQVSNLSTLYFDSVFDKFGKPRTIDVLKTQAIKDVVLSLTKEGISTAVSLPIKEMLKTNISSEVSFFQLQSQVRNLILDTESGKGILSKHTGQITTDSLNQFSASYNKAVSEDLGLDWFQYVGSLVRDSRPFCKALVKKRWVHKSEIPLLLKGKIGTRRVPVNRKTKLPFGMIKGTNKDNFQVRRGGFRCNHMLIPVPTEVVPQHVQDRVAGR